MKYGNIGKGIAFASLWIFAAIVTPGLEWPSLGVFIVAVMVGMSFAVMRLFDGRIDTKTE